MEKDKPPLPSRCDIWAYFYFRLCLIFHNAASPPYLSSVLDKWMVDISNGPSFHLFEGTLKARL